MKITLPKNKENKNIPTNYFFVVDLSGSMYGSVRDLKDTLLSLKSHLAAKDTLSLAYFSSYGDFRWIVKGANLSNTSLDSIISKEVYARGLTCYTQVLDSLKQTIDDVATQTGNQTSVLYFLSDGWPNDNSPEAKIYSACSSLKGVCSNVYIVGFSNYYNRNCLVTMSERIGGQFSHVDNYKGIKPSCEAVMSNKPSKTNVKIDKMYDLVWQVTNDIVILEQKKDKSVDAFDTDGESAVYAIDFDEIDTVAEKEAKFVYSLAVVLSQKNKANVAVSYLRRMGALSAAKLLQKSFTVSQKGNAENELKDLAVNQVGNVKVEKAAANTQTLVDFIESVKAKIGKIAIDLDKSDYSSISRSGGDVSKVDFETTDKVAKIVGVTGNENRANVSFLTVREGEITAINDAELKAKVDAYNKTAKKKIKLPIKASTFRNYALVANGDFNFKKLALVDKKTAVIVPEKQIDLFDENTKSINISDFVKLYTTLIEEKAHAAVLRFYIKENATQKHLEDLRVEQYGAEAAPILEEMGLDYQMRYAPKREYKPKDETGDYIPFTEITGALEGASKISAKDSYAKFLKNGKQNPGDKICWPLFEQYDEKLKKLGKADFVEYCQAKLEGQEALVETLSQKISLAKFYLIITNSWFDGVAKSDEFAHNGLVIKVKEVNEYL